MFREKTERRLLVESRHRFLRIAARNYDGGFFDVGDSMMDAAEKVNEMIHELDEKVQQQ